MSVGGGRIREGFLEEVIQEAKKYSGEPQVLAGGERPGEWRHCPTFTPDCELPVKQSALTLNSP